MTASKSNLRKMSRREWLGYGLGAAAITLLGRGCRRHRGRPNVVLITLDTTRADRLGCYGYHRSTSPSLDRLASQSVLYTRATAPSSWTLPAHASLFTGKFTTSHGARYDPRGPLRLTDSIEAPDSWQSYRARGLADSEKTLAEILKEAGFTTGAVVGGPWLKRVFGLHKGFDFYDDDLIHTVNGRLASEVTSAALRWMEDHGDETFFLFLNYFDPHSPYAAPEPFTYHFFPPGERLEGREPTADDLGNLYDAEILYMDHHIGRLLEGLERLDLFDPTLFVVTADHGELLGEHGKIGHGTSLYQEEIHVPLLVKYPGREVPAATDDRPIQLVDVLALILEPLDMDLPLEVQGGHLPNLGHPIVAEAYPLPFMSLEGDWRVLFQGSHKLIWNSKGTHQIYDLEADPREAQNLAPRETERVERMQLVLNGYLDSLPRPPDAGPPVELDEETKKALRSLGYIQ